MVSSHAQPEEYGYEMTTGSRCIYPNLAQKGSLSSSQQLILSNQTSNAQSHNQVSDPPTRRMRVPPEQREHLRRLKKQDMERRRRACISDKMNALHAMAMHVIGVEPQKQQKLEKADILGTCYSVLEGIAKLADNDSVLRSRLHSLRTQIKDNDFSVDFTIADESTQSSTVSEGSIRTDSLEMNKENHMPEQTNQSYYSQEYMITRIPCSLTSTPRSPLIPCALTFSRATHRSSMYDSGFHSSSEASVVSKFGSSFRSPLATISTANRSVKTSSNSVSLSLPRNSAFTPIQPSKMKTENVWRPYLD